MMFIIYIMYLIVLYFFFFFNDTAPTEISTLPLPDALPIYRGEVAVRVIRALHELGVEAVAVYSTADAGGLHTRLADRAVCIGPPAAAESYLNMPSRSEEHTSELQSQSNLVCRLLLEKKKKP